MILLINISQEKLHFYEFVKPIGDILIKHNIKGFIRHYTCVTKKDLEKASKVIICGTSLADNGYLHNLENFGWIKHFDKPLLGICGGMQVIGLVHGARIGKKTEIGYFDEVFTKDFLGLQGKQQVYHLHNNSIDFSDCNSFETTCGSLKNSQAVRHITKNMYGILFHPEVRNKEMILEFVRNG